MRRIFSLNGDDFVVLLPAISAIFSKSLTKLWCHVLNFRRLEFPNLCLIIELLTCIAGSNSTVERAFSLLTLLLMDRRWTMHHSTMEDLLITKANDNTWSESERKGITEPWKCFWRKEERCSLQVPRKI